MWYYTNICENPVLHGQIRTCSYLVLRQQFLSIPNDTIKEGANFLHSTTKLANLLACRNDKLPCTGPVLLQLSNTLSVNGQFCWSSNPFARNNPWWMCAYSAAFSCYSIVWKAISFSSNLLWRMGICRNSIRSTLICVLLLGLLHMHCHWPVTPAQCWPPAGSLVQLQRTLLLPGAPSGSAAGVNTHIKHRVSLT